MTRPDSRAENAAAPRIVSRMSRELRTQMMACLLADRVLFASARMQLKLEYFNQLDEAALRVVWLSAAGLAEKHGLDFLFTDRLQAWNTLDAEARSYWVAHPESCPLADWDEAFGERGFLPWFYGECNPAEFSASYGAHLLAQFLRERAVNDVWQEICRASASGVVTNFADVARELADRDAALSHLGDDPVKSGAPAGWLPAPTTRRPTGVVWLDRFLAGGHAAGEVYGLLGVIGAGKSTFALQLCDAVSRQEEFAASVPPEVAEAAGLPVDAPGHVYYFHYEMSEEDVRKKLWSLAAGIAYDRVERLGTRGFALSDSPNLSREEQLLLRAALQQVADRPATAAPPVNPDDFPGETIRLERAQKRLATNFWQIDMSGNGRNKDRGTGYVPEIAAILAAEARKGRRIALVVIDYAMACVERHTDDKDEIYNLLSQFGRRCESEIAVPFRTPVWVMQQLSGEANKRTAATKQHHANAMGSTRFAMSLWFAFNIGTADEETGCRYFTCSKARRADLGKSPLLKIAGGFNRLVDVSSQYHFDPRGRVKSGGDDGAAKAKVKEKQAAADAARNGSADARPPGPSSSGLGSNRFS